MSKSRIVVDSVHGDIEPNELEWQLIDTPAFQRLHKLKQLQMGYLVYPNATHTRFAHSLGVLKVMQRLLEKVGDINDQERKDLRLAALLHDLGHYPYSHLLEKVDSVILTEKLLGPSSSEAIEPYPDHEELGAAILESQKGSKEFPLRGGEQIDRICDLFLGKGENGCLSKLLHSNLDMDRIDYLTRDSQGTGVPYGKVDINYLLNNIKLSKKGVVGISHKAIGAAEHLLLARSLLFRVVYQHKTVVAFETAACHLVRRLRDRSRKCGEGYGVPKCGNEVISIVKNPFQLQDFNDAYLDRIFVKASEDHDPLIRALAESIIKRRPAELIFEKKLFAFRKDAKKTQKLSEYFLKERLRECIDSYKIKPGQLLLCLLKPVGFESRPYAISRQEAKGLKPSEETEMIQVFPDATADEPKDIVDIEYSLLHQIGGHVFQSIRLYFLPIGDQDTVEALKEKARKWDIENGHENE